VHRRGARCSRPVRQHVRQCLSLRQSRIRMTCGSPPVVRHYARVVSVLLFCVGVVPGRVSCDGCARAVVCWLSAERRQCSDHLMDVHRRIVTHDRGVGLYVSMAEAWVVQASRICRPYLYDGGWRYSWVVDCSIPGSSARDLIPSLLAHADPVPSVLAQCVHFTQDN
jgi:hypothetical protein